VAKRLCPFTGLFDDGHAYCKETYSTWNETGDYLGEGSICTRQIGLYINMKFLCIDGRWQPLEDPQENHRQKRSFSCPRDQREAAPALSRCAVVNAGSKAKDLVTVFLKGKQLCLTVNQTDVKATVACSAALVCHRYSMVIDTALVPLKILTTEPDLSTCRVSVSDSRRNVKISTHAGNLTNCDSQQDEWIRTQPTELHFAMKSGFNMDLGNRPQYISDSKVGIVGAKITVMKISAAGSITTLSNQTLDGPPFCHQRVSSTRPLLGQAQHDCEGTIQLPTLNLRDGDSLCADMESFSGGFYNLQDTGRHSKGQETYNRVNKTKRVCFMFDGTKPTHCSEFGSACNSEPLKLSTRVSRDSSIRDDHTADWDSSTPGPHDVTMPLPLDTVARLYAIILEVHDHAGNVAYARRLVLFDNTSFVELKETAALTVTSADMRTNLKWQTNIYTALCVDWHDRFYNTDMRNNNFLMPVNPDTAREIHGDYDQQSGILPVTGTDNVDGVVKFELSWRQDQSAMSPLQEVPNLKAQSTCLPSLTLVDGQTYHILIRATDIMGNYKEDEAEVSIDHTGPSVSIEGLRGRFGRDGLYVHNTTDLSSMLLLIHVTDPHSGIKTLEWTLGTRDLAGDVGRGTIGVQRLKNNSDCTRISSCYCPSVGPCEIQSYTFKFSNLNSSKISGHHHREYYITITATNHASLRSRQMMDILIDESPPTVGVVLEGLSDDDQAEMDFTSSDVVHVRWHGFLDHESGILLYRVVLADRCLTNEEMDADTNATEVDQQTVTVLAFPKEGKYFVNVVAYNGAMQPSSVSCSDGITFDKSPPTFSNVSITHARIRPAVACTKSDQPWLINANLTRSKLSLTKDCLNICSSNQTIVSVDHLPIASNTSLEEETSTDLCLRLKLLSSDDIVVLPSDYLRLSWIGVDEESEMEEYHVGMGRDRTTASAPDLLPFTPTHGHHSYHARHSGLGHGAVFFIFLRALSKAGLQVNLTLGPVIIDVTPPTVTSRLTPIVEGKYLVVEWANDTFQDPEQPNEAEFDVTFRVGHADGFVTPFLAPPDSSLSHCRENNVTGCARYPISDLQAHDTESGRSFFFQLHVMNAAGHVTTKNSSAVKLPAHFPPGHAVVMDVIKFTEFTSTTQPSTSVASTIRAPSPLPTSAFNNTSVLPENVTQATPSAPTRQRKTVAASPRFSKDKDVMLQREDICIAWTGLYHAEEIGVEVGVGTDPGKDDVIPFSLAADRSTPVCVNASTLPVYTKLFSVVRATSSGGTTVFSSDGFRFVPKHDFNNKLMVFSGKQCTDDPTETLLVTPKSPLDLNLTSSLLLHPGETLFIRFSPYVDNVTFPDAVLLQTTLTGYSVILKSKLLRAVLPAVPSTNITIEMHHCLKDVSLLPASESRIAVTWEMSGPWTGLAGYLKVGVTDNTCMKTASKNNKYRHRQCLLAEEHARASERELIFSRHHFIPSHVYTASVAVCFDLECLPSVFSQPLLADDTERSVQFDLAMLQSTSSQKMDVEFKAHVIPEIIIPSSAHHDRPCVFLWAATRDATGSVLVSDWRVSHTESCSNMQVKDTVAIHGTTQGSLYVCVQPVFPWRSESPTCQKLVRPTNIDQPNPLHVVEFSHDTLRKNDFSGVLHSQQIGNKLHELYDLDIDFAKSDIMLSAILTDGEERNVTWFLMTEERVPSDGNCASDAACVTSKTSFDGKMVFPRAQSRFRDGQTYFVCASVHSRVEQQQDAEETVCGDGVVIDDAPPVGGSVAISNFGSGYLADMGHVQVTWQGFSDVETMATNIPDIVTLKYSVALGSYPGAEDLAQFVNVGQRTAWSFSNLHVAPGVTCVATVRAQDRVGHVTEVTSEPVVIDSTPPTIGHVTVGTEGAGRYVSGGELPIRWEGVEDNESGIESIEDHKSYSTDVGVYRVYWSGFSDPHSGLDYHRVGLGSEPGQTDVLPFVYVGLQTSFSWKREFEQGKKYYATVETCNKARMCRLTSSSSLTFDNSPPIAGHVTVGFDVLMPEMTLPVATALYVTVSARNPVGLSTFSVSDSFVVDITPPVVITPPQFLSLRDGTPADNQWDRSVLRLKWQFSDPDSSVVSNTVNIRSQLTGRLVVDPDTYTSDTELVLPLDEDHLLMDGDSYWAAVTACNAAGLCTTRTSHMLLIDSTPPVVGTFESPIYWQNETSTVTGNFTTLVNVTWQGFSDAESEVVTYHLMAGSTYNGEDLSEGAIKIPHDNTSRSQLFTLKLDGGLVSGQTLHFSIWAENALGLRSSSVRMEFDVFEHEHLKTLGTLVVKRHSCKSVYCTGECTCAASGRSCETSACHSLDENSPALGGFKVFPAIGSPSGLQAFTASRKCLEGHWRLLNPATLSTVSRFEVSFSLAGFTGNEGLVFNNQTQAVWNDVGRNLEAAFCLPGKTALVASMRYVLHVQVWLSSDSNVTFTSDPILVDHSPPKIRQRKQVLDSDPSCQRDFDYITSEPYVISCWNRTFSDVDSGIVRYEVWAGTSPSACDLLKPVNVGLNTSFPIPTANLEHGTRYYVTVRATNGVGLMTTATSDGFIIDVTPPVAGVVFNSHGHTNRHAQSSTTTMHASWHGFDDRHSGVTSYHVALYDASDPAKSIRPFKNIGFRTKYMFEGLTLRDKHSYKVLVKAQDAAGLESKPVSSTPILIDTTPPEGIACNKYQREEEQPLIYTDTPTFGYNTFQAEFQVAESTRDELVKVVVRAYGLELGASGYISVGELKMPLYFKHAEPGNATAEHEFILPVTVNETMTVAVDASLGVRISAELYRCSNTAPSAQGSVTIRQMSQYDVSVCARIHDEESGIRSIIAGLGTTPGGLQVKPLTPVGHSGHAVVNVHVQHGLPLYATVHVENHAGQWSRFISLPITIDRTPPKIRDIKLSLRYEGEGEGQINGTEVWAEAEWASEDKESGVVTCECHLAGQSTLGSPTQRTSHVAHGQCTWQLRHPQHGSSVRVTVSCVNGVQIHEQVMSYPTQILLHPPDLTQATLASVSNNAMMSPFEKSDLEFRSSNSSLEFFWHGVDDPTVIQFQYRFLHESSPIGGWSPLDSYKTSAILERGSQKLPTGSVTAQVRATNARQMTSDVVSASVKVDDGQPMLTGKRAIVVCSSNILRLDWQGVFKVNRDVTFSVYAGNAEGYGDVINHVITKETSYQGACSSQESRSLFLTISAVYVSGQSTVYQAELGL
ncbi:hypothetical protein BaRGS_00015051, partial [Batillaria attramentaria]